MNSVVLRKIMSIAICATAFLFAEEKSDSTAKPDFKNWDVAHQYGEADTVDFTVSEGTWMNLDLSPDGSEIVFDLLGDIYSMPISGGKATLLAGGLPYEVQPRYSPDGTQISYTSDRGGGDNIWIMNRDGSEAKQVTKEKFRLLNNAVWTNDGQYLVARKHFTSHRSLGAGEMWMYHTSGGSGFQLTTKKNTQQDAGEPCFSHDGRYLYYSEDMSGGSTFQYNKNPNTQIYVIRRLDLEKGKLTNYISGPGGAVRPQVSPDGKYLSFVRRIRTKSVLYLHDLSTGEQWPIYDQLSHDQQEAWAIFGVYTNYQWMPDSKSIVIWAQGKIRRVDINTRSARDIPFEVEASHSIAKTPRFKQEVGSAEFDARMIRQVVTAPDGKSIVFSAIGNLWKMDLKKQNPQRLTKDNNHYEYEPSFSPDGKWVAYTTWNDTALGAVYKVSSKGGRGQKLTTRKGYYYSPSWSPDGTMIAYQRGRGNSYLGFSHGLEPGLYWIPTSGGWGNLITEEGSEPVFNKASTRVTYMQDNWTSKTYKSVNLDGSEEKTLFTSTYAADIAISPDEKWLAFQELFNLYITPLPRTGDKFDLSSTNQAIAIKKVTRDAGTSMHWSADSKSLQWVIGPEYFSRDLNEVFDFVPGAPDSLPGLDSTGISIPLNVEADTPSGAVALVGARIITMNGDKVIEDGIILVERNRIKAVGSRQSVEVPSDAATIDVTGKTIMPGMIDVHGHAGHFSNLLTPKQHWPYFANLAYGVTAMHDPSATTEVVFAQAEMVRAGKMIGPRIYSTGTILYGADGDFKAVVNGLDDARSHLRRMKAVGAFSVKSYNQPRRNQRQQVMQAARELEMMVYPEGGSFFFHNMSMILDGHTGIEHNIPVAPAYDDVIKLWSASETGYTPTLLVSYGGLSGEYYWYQHYNVWENPRLLTYTPRAMVDSRSRRRQMTEETDYHHIEVARTCKALNDAGVKVNVGGHGQLQGLGVHWEMWSLAQGGMTNMESIRAATLNGAYYIGMEDNLGSIEVGKLADLIVMNQDPLLDIRNSDDIQYVMKNGRIYDASTMKEIGNYDTERIPFYWEHDRASDAFIWKQGVGFGIEGCGCGRH